MRARTYRVWCATCDTEWTGTDIDEAEVPAGEVRAFCICSGCGHVGRVSLRLPAAELVRYRRDIRKTIGKMVESFLRVRARLEERCRKLKQRIREGAAGAIDTLKVIEERLAALRPPDVDHLRRRLSEAERAEPDAPRTKPPEPECPECRGRTRLYRETPHGYEMTCPGCGGKLHARVR